MNTKYAPAGRAPEAEIDRQASIFRENAVIDHFLEKIPAIFLVVNRHRQIVFMNKGALDFSGLDEVSKAIGKRPGELLGCIHSKEEEDGCGTSASCTFCGAVNAILESQKGKSVVKDARLLLGNDHTAFDLRVWAKPLRFGGEDFTAITIQDIRHEKWRAFLERIFYHDILNTVSGLSGTLELLRNYKEKVNTDELIQRADNITRALIEEIQSQQILTAAESNLLKLNLTTCDSLAILKEIVQFYEKSEKGEQKRVKIDNSSESVEIVTDRTLLKRVLGNMVKNAFEATSNSREVVIGCKIVADRVQFWVHNDEFIPRDIQLQIFNRSFSTKGQNRGLGTYSMKLLSSFLNGTVRFTSPSAEEGTTFFAEYPLKIQGREQECN